MHRAFHKQHVLSAVLFTLLACSGASAAAAQAPISDSSQQSNPDSIALPQVKAEVVRGDFTQSKYLAELDQPLVSSGHFVVARGHGLIWQVEKPVKTTLVIGQTQLVQSNNGQETLRIDANQQPGLNVVAALLLAVFQADVARLRDFFDVDSHSEKDHWTLQLKPKSAAVAKFISSLTIDGGESINRIEIDEAGGDRSVIQLRNATPDPDGLNAAEHAEFSD